MYLGSERFNDKSFRDNKEPSTQKVHKMKKKKIQYMSRTTPGHEMQLRTWLAETLMIRQINWKLPEKFWTLPKYKFKFATEIKAVSKYIKKYGEGAVVRAVLDNKKLTSMSDYAFAEVCLQNEEASLKRISLPKDTSPAPERINNISSADLRDARPEPKENLFTKLDRIING